MAESERYPFDEIVFSWDSLHAVLKQVCDLGIAVSVDSVVFADHKRTGQKTEGIAESLEMVKVIIIFRMVIDGNRFKSL